MKNLINRYFLILTVLAMSLCSEIAWSESNIINIEGVQIRGNQELPTVLYVVPWQVPKVYRLETPNSNLAVQRPLKAIDRNSFKRYISYHEMFKTLDKSANLTR